MPVAFSTLYPVSPILSGVVSTTRPPLELIGREVLPRISVANPAYVGTIFVDTHTSFMGTSQGLERAPGGPMAKMSTTDPTTVSYACKVYSLASEPIPTQQLARSQFPEDLLSREAIAVQSAMALAEEIRVKTLFQTTANWTTTVACASIAAGSGVKFSDPTGKAMEDITKVLETFSDAAHGASATHAIIDRTTCAHLRAHPNMRGLYFTTSGGGAVDRVLKDADLKAIFMDVWGLTLHIGKARYNSAALGQAHSEAAVWADTMWIGCLGNPNAVTAGTDVRASRVAAIGIDEVSTQPASANGSMSNFTSPMIAGTEDVAKTLGDGVKVWCEQVCTEVKLAANLGLTVTDCV